MRRALIATAILALAAGCQSAPKDNDAITIVVGDDGKMRVVSAGNSADNQALAALMQLTLDGGLDAEADAEPLKEDEIWREDAAGNLTHIQSGAQCPVNWGEYTRGRTSIFKPDGTDVGCNYSSPDGKVLTFYVYQSDLTLTDELNDTMITLKTRQPVSTDERFGSGPPPSLYVGKALAYEDADGTRMRTSLALADGGAWRLKMRLTCKAAVAAQAENAAGLALMGQADRLDTPQPPRPSEARSPV
jgi:hypothetical protein